MNIRKRENKCLALHLVFPFAGSLSYVRFLQQYQQYHLDPPINRSVTSHLPSHLKHARASTLNSLHLRLAVHRPPEPLRQLVAVPELALLGLHAAELSRGAAANTTVWLETRRRSLGSAAAHHGAVLAGFLAVGGERFGEGLGGGGWVDFGCVVDFLGGIVSGWVLRERWVESLPLGTERRPRNLIMGVCLKRTLVARIFAVVCGVCGV